MWEDANPMWCQSSICVHLCICFLSVRVSGLGGGGGTTAVQLGGVHVKSPGHIRLGLSRNVKVRPLHPSANTTTWHDFSILWGWPPGIRCEFARQGVCVGGGREGGIAGFACIYQSLSPSLPLSLSLSLSLSLFLSLSIYLSIYLFTSFFLRTLDFIFYLLFFVCVFLCIAWVNSLRVFCQDMPAVICMSIRYVDLSVYLLVYTIIIIHSYLAVYVLFACHIDLSAFSLAFYHCFTSPSSDLLAGSVVCVSVCQHVCLPMLVLSFFIPNYFSLAVDLPNNWPLSTGRCLSDKRLSCTSWWLMSLESSLLESTWFCLLPVSFSTSFCMSACKCVILFVG